VFRYFSAKKHKLRRCLHEYQYDLNEIRNNLELGICDIVIGFACYTISLTNTTYHICACIFGAVCYISKAGNLDQYFSRMYLGWETVVL